MLELREEKVFFWATQAGAELNLFTFIDGKRIGFEFKYVDAPKVIKSMNIAIEDLKSDKLLIVYPDKTTYPMTEKITALGLDVLATYEKKDIGALFS